jgi:predicted nucleic acid-binding protein
VIRPDAIGHQQAVRLVELFRRFPVQDLTSGMMTAALDARQRLQLSYQDAAIPRAMGCTQVLSEDLGGRQDHGGVRPTNLFR